MKYKKNEFMFFAGWLVERQKEENQMVKIYNIFLSIFSFLRYSKLLISFAKSKYKIFSFSKVLSTNDVKYIQKKYKGTML